VPVHRGTVRGQENTVQLCHGTEHCTDGYMTWCETICQRSEWCIESVHCIPT
jgi:hypothetical protein